MRIFTNWKEARQEVKRDLKEMGIEVYPKSYQDIDVSDKPEFKTYELQNYIYTVTQPHLEDFSPTQPWADAEFKERLEVGRGYGINPGKAWKLREEVWAPFLHQGVFAYTYSERMAFQLQTFVDEFERNPETRQGYISIWDPQIDPYNLGGVARVPCSLGYLLQVRQGTLNLTYLMRSCDFATHFENDAYLAVKFMHWMAESIGQKPGTFTHFIGSLHVFHKDVSEVF